MDYSFNDLFCPPNSYAFPIPTPTFFWVPCVVDPTSKEFQPLFSYSEFVEKTTITANKAAERESGIFSFRKDEWTREEDLALFRHVVLHGPKAWSRISRDLNSRFHGNRSVRVGKHCRGRWYNHLDPSIKKEGWSTHEDIQLLQFQATLGNCWSLISKKMNGRNENSVKNRWNSLLKQARQVHKSADSEDQLAAKMLEDLLSRNEFGSEVDSYASEESSLRVEYDAIDK
eukprot:CAMPEP_0204905556 /NCGR_PEP_ID=MMETSP1397-20131031/5483_1 /ASSEMBLY_ACC=CAM_ASM_000891 /TAXON_ID=49980 /ORGANISM="Climacostomum Climacostomum virens, Strain Stock W-24" /LENGTH=228 /DNA_ID=CAMNT_0052074443 /DNA_START=105 /DNA_END=791 /DNA_ORIENTATION=-